MFHQADLFETTANPARAMDTPSLMAAIAAASQRPKFSYMLLQLLAEVADEKGSAGPSVSGSGGKGRGCARALNVRSGR